MEEILIDKLVGYDVIVDKAHHLFTQRRFYSRSARDDIEVWMKGRGIFFKNNRKPVSLINISQGGAAISCDRKFKEKSRQALIFRFEDGKEFLVKARIVHRSQKDHEQLYGILFEETTRVFDDHLLKTGLRLKLNRHVTGNNFNRGRYAARTCGAKAGDHVSQAASN